MGSACAKTSNPNPHPPPPPVHRHQSPDRVPNTRVAQLQNIMNNEYASHLNFEHALNINHKFAENFQILNNAFTGQGIKKTYSYVSHLSKEEMIRKREEFWGFYSHFIKRKFFLKDTRTEGKIETWQTIRAAINEKEEANSLAFLKASGLNLVKNSLQFVFDDHGKKYEVPVFCINEPSKYELKPNSANQIPVNFKKEKIKIKIRCAIANDLELEIENTTSLKDIKDTYITKNGIDPKEYATNIARFFYKGKEMKDNHQIGEYNPESECVIQLFLRKNDV